MAIQSASEFEAILNRVMMTIDKALAEKDHEPLKEARRTMEKAANVSRDPTRLKALSTHIESAGDVIRAEIASPELGEQLWDLVDYIEYRA